MDNLVNSIVNNSVGKLTNQLIIDGLRANPNMSQQQLSQTLGVSMKEIAGALSEDAQKSGFQTTTIGNAETGQAVSNIRDIGGGFNAYQDENGQISGFSRVDPSKPGMIQLYGPQGELRGEQKITSTTQDMLRTLGPIALAAGGSALAQSLMAGGSTALNTLGSAALDADIAGGLIPQFGTNAAADAFMASAMTPEAIASLGATVAAAPEVIGSGAALTNAAANTANVANAANTASTVANTANAANAANAVKTIIDPLTGLAIAAGSNVLSNVANQQGITDARNAITQGSATANTALNNAYANAQNLGAAGRTDLNNIFANQNTNLNNILNAQSGVYGQTNQNLANNYQNLNTNLNNTLNAQAGVYGDTNTALGNIYSNTSGNLQNLYNQQVGYQNPYQDIGRAGSTGLLNNQDYLTRQFTNADLNANLAPNYAFQLQQGQMANQRAANMGGGSLGGNALRGLQDYTQNYAQGAYQNAFNNFQGQRQNIYNTLSGMANIGTTSAGQLTNLGNAYGSNMGSLSSNFAGNRIASAGQMQNAYNQYGSNLLGGSNAYAGNMVNNANTMQNAYNQFGSNLTNSANTFGSNLTTNYGQGMNAANVYGLNSANLATGTASALASNATATGANNATALSNLGNTALLGSMIKAT